METDYEQMGTEAGKIAGRSFFDGNTRTEVFTHILKGYDMGDCGVMDLCPSPLSGEWAGESIEEIFGCYPSDDSLTEYEMAFCDSWWHEVITWCHTMTGKEAN